MLSKNNHLMKAAKNAPKKQRFGLRKLTVGVASVLLGTTFLMGAQVAKADSNADQETTSTTTQLSSSTPAADNQQGDQQNTGSTNAGQNSNTLVLSNGQNNGQASQTQSAPNSSLTAAELGASLREGDNQTTITDNGQTSINLAHGDNSNHVLAVNVVAGPSDNVSVKVPSIFQPDNETGAGFTVTPTTNADNSTTLTYHFTTSGSHSLNIGLTPTVSDWSFLTEGTRYTVDVNKNGALAAQVVYIIQTPAQITDAVVSLDPNQHGNLVTGQKYAVGVQLPNNCQNDGDRLKGTITVNVPAGFQLDSNGAYGYVDNFGDVDTISLAVGGGSLSQPGGAGTPVVITFNTPKVGAAAQLYFWGTYTQPLSASANTFRADVSYQSTDGSHSSTTQTVTGQVLNTAMPVNSTQRSNITTTMTMPDKIATDNGTANGTHQSDDTHDYKYPNGWSFKVKNDGNVVQTNVKLHVDVEPGTVFKGGISFTTTRENAGATVVATLNDGSQVTLPVSHFTGDVDNAGFSADTAALDGSNVKALDITFDKINAGSAIDLTMSSLNSILSKATTKKVNDKANYSYTVTSDQGIDLSGNHTATIVDPDPVHHVVSLDGHSSNFINGTYDKNSTGGSALMNKGQIMYVLSHDEENDSRPSSYLLVIPAGFHVGKDAQGNEEIKVMWNGQVLPSTSTDPHAKTGKITALGAVGPAGEYVYRVDLSFTPGQNGSGNPVYVQADNNQNIPLEINDHQDPASYNYVQHTLGNYSPNPYPDGIALLMEIDNNHDIVRNNFQANDPQTVTLGGVTYPVVMESLGWHELPGFQYTDAQYSFVAPSTYGSESGIKNDHESAYHNDDETPAEFAYSDNENGVPNAGYTTGQLKLTNILTDGGTSKYSYNVVNLPSTANGNDATLTLTGPGRIVGNGASTTKLLYSMTPLTKKKKDLTASDLANYVDASQVTDWSKVRSVLLQSGQLANNTVLNAYLPFKVTGMKAGLNEASLRLLNIFTGDHSNSTYNHEGYLQVHISRYVQVKTNWVKQADDGTQTPIKTTATQNVQSGNGYTTSGLADSEIPSDYELSSMPTNATGTTGATNVTVTYVYVKKSAPAVKKQQASLKFVDDNQDGASLHADLTAAGKAGHPIVFTGADTDVNSLLDGGYVLASVTDAKGNVLVGPRAARLLVSLMREESSSIDWSTIFGDFDNDDSTNQTFTLHFVHGAKSITDSGTATRTVHYKENSMTGADLQNPTVQTVEFSGSHDVDATDQSAKPAAVNTKTITDAFGNEAVVIDPDNSATPSETWTAGTPSSFAKIDGPASLVKDGTTWQLTAASKGNAPAVTPSAPADNQNVFLIYTPAEAPVTPTYTDVSDHKTVHETIHYVYADGSQAANDATAAISFSRSGRRNDATGITTWDAWTPADGSFATVSSPVINGYTADQPQIAAQDVTADSHDLTFTVTYTKQGTPDTPVTPTNPDQPTTPTKPGQPSQPTIPGHASQQPTNPANSAQPGAASQPATLGVQKTQPSTETPASQQPTKLPQTGNQSGKAVLGLGTTSLIAALGLLGYRRRHN